MKGKKWTDKEIEYLGNNWGRRSREQVARRLGKSVNACRAKAERLGIGSSSKNTEGIPVFELQEIIGVSSSNIFKTWIEGNNLKTKKVGMFVVVDEKDLVQFMKEHPHLWDARKCDYYYFYTYDWFIDKLMRERDKGYAETKVKKWTTHEERELMTLRRRGYTFAEIGQKLNRTKSSVGRKYSILSTERTN